MSESLAAYHNIVPHNLISKTEETLVNSRSKATPFRHFGIRPESDEAEDDKGATLTFRFISQPRFENNHVLPFSVQQSQLTTALKLSHPYGVILQSKERTAVYPVLQFWYGSYDLNPKVENYMIQGYFTNTCVYKEIREIEPEEETGRGYRFNAYYIILGFKTTDSQALLDSWKDWTGSRYIYINFPDLLRLGKITLYHKQTSDDVNLFNYMVKVDCDDVDSKQKQTILMDFVQRLRAERTSNFCSLYEEMLT